VTTVPTLAEQASPPTAAGIELRAVVKRYGTQTALRGLDLEIRDGEFFCLLGPSGCGKTTTLNLIGGFVGPTEGEIWIQGRRIDTLPPHKRPVNTVFQSYALFPHMNVFENVRFGLKMDRVPRDESAARVREALQLVGLEDFGDRMPSQLSGGQQQRVAVARALVKRPAVLLLDEPLGALDLKLRQRLQIELSQIHRDVGTTFVYVTHDQEEAMSMADRIAVMNAGRIEQIGTPQEIYDRPASMFVADFIGSPPMNFLHFEAGTEVGDRAIRYRDVSIPVPEVREARAVGPLVLGVRPEHILFSDAAAVRGRVFGAEYLGTTQIVTVETEQGRVKARLPSSAPVEVGETVGLAFRSDDLSLFDARTGSAIQTAAHGSAAHG